MPTSPYDAKHGMRSASPSSPAAQPQDEPRRSPTSSGRRRAPARFLTLTQHARPQICHPATSQDPRVHRHRAAHARPRHRAQHRDVQYRQLDRAAAAEVSRRRQPFPARPKDEARPVRRASGGKLRHDRAAECRLRQDRQRTAVDLHPGRAESPGRVSPCLSRVRRLVQRPGRHHGAGTRVPARGGRAGPRTGDHPQSPLLVVTIRR